MACLIERTNDLHRRRRRAAIRRIVRVFVPAESVEVVVTMVEREIDEEDRITMSLPLSLRAANDTAA